MAYPIAFSCSDAMYVTHVMDDLMLYRWRCALRHLDWPSQPFEAAGTVFEVQSYVSPAKRCRVEMVVWEAFKSQKKCFKH